MFRYARILNIFTLRLPCLLNVNMITPPLKKIASRQFALFSCLQKNSSSKSTSIHRKFKYERSGSTHQKYFNQSSSHLLSNYLYGRTVCKIAMETSRRPIFKVLVNTIWQKMKPNDERVLEILDIADKRGISIEYKSTSALYTITDGRPHQGVCLEVGELPLTRITDNIVKGFTSLTASPMLPCLVLLYDIKDPMNVGAILRSCCFLGIDKVLLTSHCSPITATASKASSGASEVISLYLANESVDFIKHLIEAGWDIIGTDIPEDDGSSGYEFADESFNSEGSNTPVIDISKVQLSKPFLLVFGSEGSGIPEEVKRLCTKLVTVESCWPNSSDNKFSFVSCLNVSAAAAIILHHLMKNQK